MYVCELQEWPEEKYGWRRKHVAPGKWSPVRGGRVDHNTVEFLCTG